ncbi:MAG: pentapeptide repeat-containing protein [Deltaproteobacteria bacterium]|nr:pentapeptide repeat-containing protein [Deltaproteobacteria bacterium]
MGGGMEPNYFPGRLPEEQPGPKFWKGKKPTGEALRQILEDHEDWVKDGWQGNPPHIPSGANLSFADIRFADFSRATFTGAKLVATELRRALHGASCPVQCRLGKNVTPPQQAELAGGPGFAKPHKLQAF